jgi:hypothetical protein
MHAEPLAGALDDELRALDQVHHRLRDLVVRHRHHVVDVLLDELRGQLGGLLDGDAVGNGSPGALCGLDGHDPHALEPVLRGDRHTGGEPPTAHRHDEQPRLGRVGRDLESHRALARDHVRVGERVDQRQPGALRQLAGGLLGVLVAALDKLHLRPQRAHGLELRQRAFGRHADRDLRAGVRRGARHGLSVIARAGGHEPAFHTLARQLRDRVRRSAQLERPGGLEVLRLQADWDAEMPREIGRREYRRAPRKPLEAGLRVLDVSGSDYAEKAKARSLGTARP